MISRHLPPPVPEEMAAAVPGEDMDVMGKSVEQRFGQVCRAELLGPFVERRFEVVRTSTGS